MSLEQIDQENSDFREKNFVDIERGKISLKEIIGTELKTPSVYIPRRSCPQLYSGNLTTARRFGLASIYSLLPMYDKIFFPIKPQWDKAKIKENSFTTHFGISLKDFLSLIEKNKIIPYFTAPYKEYDEKLVRNFLEPGLPRIHKLRWELLTRYNTCSIFDGNCEKCTRNLRKAENDFKNIETIPKEKGYNGSCSRCLGLLYNLGINRKALMDYNGNKPEAICNLMDSVAARNIDAVVETNCPISKKALGFFSNSIGRLDIIESVVTGLKIKYTNDIALDDYISLIDANTTKAIREIVNKIMKDPFACRYSDNLNSMVIEYNKEIEELSKSKAAKFYGAFCDLAVYGGTEFIKRKTNEYVNTNKLDLTKVSSGLSSALLDIHAKVTGKDWTITQIYKTRCKLDKCKTLA
jgi:hypothetical protein